jgi:RNA ligase (TIGR02306 family)
LERLTIYPHPNADLLELAEVGLYRAVVGKGQFQTGDYAFYIPEQAIMPKGLIEELGLTGKLAGKDKNRVKAVRLRGELSQGIVCRPKELDNFWDVDKERPQDRYLEKLAEIGDDWAESLGIVKWEPPIPVGMAGEVEAALNLMRWPDIENIKRFPGIFTPGEPVVATEKVHGTCCLLTWQRDSDEVWVTSKGLGGRSLALKASQANLYWRAVWRYRLAEVARDLGASFNAQRVGLFGEVFGAGVQDLHYGAAATQNDTLGYAMFDIAVERGGETEFLGTNLAEVALAQLANEELRGVPWVPVLYRGPYDYEALAALAEGEETVSGQGLHIREGLVVRPSYERRSPETGGRAIAKFVAEGYLTRGGEVTEYE